ncbi:MAG TPA: type III PLP-dependent enzyme, partial [Acetobacteraceae bacterium]|nr:type III PLP-dependent enzyme [Acetobacteraceae bacterium]
STEVVLASRRGEDAVRWVYLDIGRFGGLAETEGEAIRYRIATAHDGTPTGPVAIAGPTCDGADIMYERANYHLPLALTAGDRVALLAAGAYVSTYASQGFNGFAPLAEHYL